MKAGDVVQLKSGGSRMTLEGKTDYGEWICVWWNKQKEIYESRTFSETSLELISET